MKKSSNTCARCGRRFGPLMIRECPNEAVKRILGDEICYYCCKKCKYHVKHPMCGAIGCDYHNTGN